MENLTHEKQNIEIARHDERLKVLEGFVEEMKTNHLPHIYDSLKKIELRLAQYATAIIVVFSIIEIAIKVLK